MNGGRQPEHEEALIRAFIVPQKQQRWLDLLANPKRRRDILRTLPHLKDLDERFILRVPSPQSRAMIVEMLRARGAGSHCYLLSEDSKLDAHTLSLEDAISAIVGTTLGTLVSCVPGQLGYFEGEDRGERLVLERRAA